MCGWLGREERFQIIKRCPFFESDESFDADKWSGMTALHVM